MKFMIGFVHMRVRQVNAVYIRHISSCDFLISLNQFENIPVGWLTQLCLKFRSTRLLRGPKRMQPPIHFYLSGAALILIRCYGK